MAETKATVVAECRTIAAGGSDDTVAVKEVIRTPSLLNTTEGEPPGITVVIGMNTPKKRRAPISGARSRQRLMRPSSGGDLRNVVAVHKNIRGGARYCGADVHE